MGEGEGGGGGERKMEEKRNKEERGKWDAQCLEGEHLNLLHNYTFRPSCLCLGLQFIKA